MKNSKIGVIVGALLTVVGVVLAGYNAWTSVQILTGIWTPVNNKGEATGATLNIILCVVGVIALIAGIVCIIKASKKNQK